MPITRRSVRLSTIGSASRSFSTNSSIARSSSSPGISGSTSFCSQVGGHQQRRHLGRLRHAADIFQVDDSQQPLLGIDHRQDRIVAGAEALDHHRQRIARSEPQKMFFARDQLLHADSGQHFAHETAAVGRRTRPAFDLLSCRSIACRRA